MAQAVDISPVGRAVEAAMLDLVGRIREEANERGKVASGKTLASLRTSVQSAPGFVVGTLTGGSWWRYVGNGRGPGGIPPIEPIRAWIQSKGLSLSPYAVALKMAREGSRDYRLKRTNIFTDSIAAWEDSDVLEAVGDAGLKAFGEAYVQQVRNTFKPTA
jgi:hypothetical protein